MGDDAVPGPEVQVSTVPPEARANSGETRSAKMVSLRAGLAKIAEANSGMVAPAEAAPEAAAVEKPAPAVETAPDPTTAKGIEAIEKRDARAREQFKTDVAKVRAELDVERAEIARMRAEASKAPDHDSLKKLPVKDRYREALRLVGIDPDDEEHAEIVARDAYARSKSGKADPKNKVYAEQVAEKSALQAELTEMRKQLEQVQGEFKTRDSRAEMERFQSSYLDAAVKAIPVEPTPISMAHSANPEKTRAALLALGQQLERDIGETPTHAEVIAEYNRRAFADLSDRGFSQADIAALLKRAAPSAEVVAKPAPTRTLDPDARPTATPINGNPTRDQKIAAARAGLRKLSAEA